MRFGEWGEDAFAAISAGDSWGDVVDCAWLRLRGAVPAGVERPVLLLGSRGEARVHDPRGAPLDAVSTVFQQADLPLATLAFTPFQSRTLRLRP